VVYSIPDGQYSRVALAHELRAPRLVPFVRAGRAWTLRLERPPVDRLEYQLEVEHPGGNSERIVDPTNPLRTPGVFGDKSVVEFPGYEAPAWVGDTGSPRGDLHPVTLGSRALRTSIEALLWSAADTDPSEPLPLLVVHDGPQYAEYSSLLRLLDHLVAFGELPPLRAALLPPPLDRNESYSASTRYARALAEEWLPELAEAAPSPSPPAALGASLGALSLLHLHWAQPGSLGGLLLQSGSFFRRRFDAHESWMPRYERITRFVSRVAGARNDPGRIPVTITCGTGEENLDNNRFLAALLDQRGWDVRLVEHPDAHNWISWRDSLHPHLADLVLRTL
jgi:enterochelin esterase-like enzyme